MPYLIVELLRCTREDFPGWVECRLIDADGRAHRFEEKAPVVSAQLCGDAAFPQPGAIACERVGEREDASGRRRVQVDTRHPWSVQSDTGLTRFEVLASQVLERAP
ncbi:hypothetical protein SAMN04487939_10855 [Lysobacter sp. yr284]|uniref:hypothetical protein n=1 Tax=Lysobacter sp. yr284 TaxID=1761791 RepID=UPI000896A3D0|nr:hypothetical protein [Lysobacter sp. yr284]SDY90043.1 hypothetical protein SAMN04487939_10855 [Lysobacter sp. yr284]